MSRPVTRRIALAGAFGAVVATCAGLLAWAGEGPRSPFVADPASTEAVRLEHRAGIPWYAAAAPARRHRHWEQTRGWYGLEWIGRCACGALRYLPDGAWIPERKPRVCQG